jgi:hypothetical protein
MGAICHPIEVVAIRSMGFTCGEGAGISFPCNPHGSPTVKSVEQTTDNLGSTYVRKILGLLRTMVIHVLCKAKASHSGMFTLMHKRNGLCGAAARTIRSSTDGSYLLPSFLETVSSTSLLQQSYLGTPVFEVLN